MAYNRNTPFNDLSNLPPSDFIESAEILKHLARASRHLGELSGLCASLPHPQLLINTIVLQESKDSSAIENIVTTQDELFKAASEDGAASHAAKEVLSCREALYIGLEKMSKQKNILWLKKLTDANIVKPQKIGRTTYYINYRLMELLAADL